MNKITIYFGPKSKYEQIIPEYDVITLSRLVRDNDAESKHLRVVSADSEIVIEPKYYQNLVIHSDEYMSVNEHVILNFEGFINYFDIENIYLHNPPAILMDKLVKAYDNVEIINNEFNRLTKEQLIKAYNLFDQTVIGQNNAKRKIFSSLVPLMRECKTKPIIIMFYGPSGVGKTITAKYLASAFGGKLFRRQCSMFQNIEFITYLFGGKHNEKCFAKELLERDGNVILLDEFDKAPNIFHSAFYQMFDEGIFEDKNYTVDLSNAIIICTSNYASEAEIRKALGDPIHSRFNICIEFSKLANNDIAVLVKRIFEEHWNKLSEEEKEDIDYMKIQNALISKSHLLSNTRYIDNIIGELLSNEILQKYLRQ